VRIQYSLSGALLALTMALILEGALELPLLLGWLIGINVFTLVFFGIDKLNSQSSAPQRVRVPEFALAFLALVGGSPAALVAMVVLSHKTSKTGFLLLFLMILGVQGAVVYYFRDLVPWP
jgi:uncharacterized membrane protein YsdA (DUF1294 family)